MRGDQLALQAQCHAKAQKAPREIFGILLPFLKVFLIPPHSTKKTIEKDFLRFLVPWYEIAGWVCAPQLQGHA
jgi:hypothetical protein